MLTVDDMRVIAYHEAGHAIVAWSRGVLLKEVRIGTDGGICKHALMVSPLLDPELMGKHDWTKVEKKALILLAGEVAEQIAGEMAQLAGDKEMVELCRFAHEASSESVEPGSDREELRELVKLVFGNLGIRANEWIEQAEVNVKNILLCHWKKVCLLSNALVDQSFLDGVEATRIIEIVE